MSRLGERAKRAAEAVGVEVTRCPGCGRPLPGGRLPPTRILLPQKDALPGETEREPIPPQCRTCANPYIYEVGGPDDPNED